MPPQPETTRSSAWQCALIAVTWSVPNRCYQRNFVQDTHTTNPQTYAGIKLNLVIATNHEELRLAVLHHDKIFPGVPIVFTGVSARRLEGQKMSPGVAVPVGIRETIALALRLQPDTPACHLPNSRKPWALRQSDAAPHAEQAELRSSTPDTPFTGRRALF
jgi:hypothetical protein